MQAITAADSGGEHTPVTVYLRDYLPPAYWIRKTELRVDIGESGTEVTTHLHLQRNDAVSRVERLALNGEKLTLLDIRMDDRPLGEDAYTLDEHFLTLLAPPESFVLTTRAAIDPVANTSLEGLYKSRTIYCTQCEAEGFRKITWYLDRPDVMSDFTTTIVADKTRCPVLLSNGNLVDSGDLADNRHYATWHDPHKKPCYLFALVAGELDVMTDHFTTASGREVELRIYVESKDLDKCHHAMRSLKAAMRWDEEVYGREYDLDIFMIVAVDDFNMGAMENKGLNIFNTSCVLAHPATTTDAGFQRVEAVVAHEYFHNWSGNRVTCRDWFQLSLKEGFTVFRDSEFSADMNSATVKRVEDVSFLRTLQFAEDAGPMAHPVRPASYMEISNFYTLTVYEKGAEVVRMLARLLGPALFRRGTDLYFERHDGQAVTTEDFVSAMADVSGRDFTQFKRWYDQAGTPVIDARDHYDPDARRYTLTLRQQTPPTPECEDKQPFHIPVAMGLIGDAGELALYPAGEIPDDLPADNTTTVLELTEREQTFVFERVPEKPIPSLLRGFSAPVKLRYEYSRGALAKLIARDTDGFTRWEASQALALQVIDDAMLAYRQQRLSQFVADPVFIGALVQLWQSPPDDQAMLALMLQLPGEGYIAEQYTVVDVEAIHAARQAVAGQVAQSLRSEFSQCLQAYDHRRDYSPDASAIAERSLKNLALSYLMMVPDADILSRCQLLFREANNMTDQMAALTALVNCESPIAAEPAEAALEAFYRQWAGEALVVNQWFSLQARSSKPGALTRVEALLQHPAYDPGNPNKIRSLVAAFAAGNPMGFHTGTPEDPTAGYRFLADQVIDLNRKNPQIAAGLLRPLVQWRRYDESRRQAMREQLARIQTSDQLSADVYEVVSKALALAKGE